jgi:hypothetical protein
MPAGSEIAKLVEEILASVKTSGNKELGSWRHPERDIRRLARRDYAPSVHKLLGRADIEEVLHAARRILPDLNRDHDPLRIERWLNGSPTNSLDTLFSQVINRLDVHFQCGPFTGPEGLALRGFFVDRNDESLRRPLIYVNTAHHPVAVAATFFHEVGHLVAAEVFERPHPAVQLFFDADYISHLDDVDELTADIVLSLAAYPAPIARTIFETPWKWNLLSKTTELSDQVFSQVSEHFRARFGVSLASANLPARRKLNYLAGMIHFAKLRSTLLAEYGVCKKRTN